MDVITIESSDDGDSCNFNDEDEVECSCVGAKSPHGNDDDDDGGSTSSDDSIWNKSGLSLSLKRKSVDLLVDHPADNGDGDVEVKKLGCNPPQTAALQCSNYEQSNDNASKKTTEMENSASKNKYITQDSVDIDDHDEEPLPPEVPLNANGTWRMVH